jgi:murein DD-endopeptidase MepM/ murein hydrolase activator NlpD
MKHMAKVKKHCKKYFRPGSGTGKYRSAGVVLGTGVLVFASVMTLPGGGLTAALPAGRQATQNAPSRVALGSSHIDAETDITQNKSGNGCFATTAITIRNSGKLADALERYVENHQPDSPFANLGEALVSGAKQENVNPMLLVGIAQKESMLGTAWGSNSPDSYNAFGRRANESQPSIDGWYRYDSWEQSLEGGTDFDDIPNYIRRVFIENGAVSIEEFVNQYAPPEQNDTQLYRHQLRQSIEEMIELAGDSIRCGSGQNWMWPTGDGGAVLSCFGKRTAPQPIGPNKHAGIDITPDADPYVLAANSGEVITARHTGAAGLIVEIQHNENLITRYHHNSSLLVNVGETVSAGQRIAYVGTSGNATHPHVHFEISRNQKAVNPAQEMDIPGAISVNGANCSGAQQKGSS